MSKVQELPYGLAFSENSLFLVSNRKDSNDKFQLNGLRVQKYLKDINYTIEFISYTEPKTVVNKQALDSNIRQIIDTLHNRIDEPQKFFGGDY